MDRLLRNALILAITGFFAVMWGLLLRQNLVLQVQGPLRPDYERLLPPGEHERVERWGVYFGKSRIGAARLRVARDPEGYLELESNTNIDVGEAGSLLFGTPPSIGITFRARISALRGLQSFTARSDALEARFLGSVEGDSIRISGQVADQGIRTTVPYDTGSFLTEALSPMVSVPELRESDLGRTWQLRMLNPLAGGIQNVNVRVQSSRQVELADGTLSVFRLVFTSPSGRWHSWVTGEGRILVQGTPLGLSLRREGLPAAVASALEAQGAVPPPER